MSDTPARIGRYEIQSVLGRGAMGVIYKAHDPAIDRLVAIKLVRADLLSGRDRDEYLVRFQHEAQAAGRCMHPNVVAIYDFALHEGNPFLAMEYVQGVSLSEAIARGTSFQVADTVYIVRQLLEALACAHGLGIVHRDVKPANIMLLAAGRVKVTDFGISRIEASHLTQSGSVIGTPSYMSPEQCRGDEVDARSDIFSAGAVFYELLTGERPFPGKTFSEVMHKVLNAEPRDIRELVPSVPEGVRLAALRALAKRPEDRFAAAQAMADALREATRGEAVTATAADRTLIVPHREPAEPATAAGSEHHGPDTDRFDPGVLDTLERRLARHVGPIAKRLVQSAVRRADSVEGLCDILARSIEQPKERALFLNETVGMLRTQPGMAAARTTTIAPGSNPAIPPDEVELVQRDLARFLGPIAKVLVKRALGQAGSGQDLRDKLAAHIENAADRARFLKGR
jgi:serine/threonine protein kinase